jgi:hypothetical protein
MASHPDTPSGTPRRHSPDRERRAYPRFLFPRCAGCRARPLTGSDWSACDGLDVSLVGLAVRLAQPAVAGQVLIVELRRAEPAVFLSRLLRVVYAFPMAGGGYRIGGQFLRALGPVELEQLLQLPGAAVVAEPALPAGPHPHERPLP